jgi:YidC/Oxa1 family membrane protein insertase
MRAISKFFGTIFQPIFHGIAWLLAFFYGLVPNYLFAIVLLTIVIMGVLTPLTVKSTKSMMAMQKLQPEIKKLQQKYKGPENRQMLNDEMMKLYREQGVNPVGGCLPDAPSSPISLHSLQRH